jgi:hypothetical protein
VVTLSPTDHSTGGGPRVVNVTSKKLDISKQHAGLPLKNANLDFKRGQARDGGATNVAALEEASQDVAFSVKLTDASANDVLNVRYLEVDRPQRPHDAFLEAADMTAIYHKVVGTQRHHVKRYVGLVDVQWYILGGMRA